MFIKLSFYELEITLNYLEQNDVFNLFLTSKSLFNKHKKYIYSRFIFDYNFAKNLNKDKRILIKKITNINSSQINKIKNKFPSILYFYNVFWDELTIPIKYFGSIISIIIMAIPDDTKYFMGLNNLQKLVILNKYFNQKIDLPHSLIHLIINSTIFNQKLIYPKSLKRLEITSYCFNQNIAQDIEIKIIDSPFYINIDSE